MYKALWDLSLQPVNKTVTKIEEIDEWSIDFHIIHRVRNIKWNNNVIFIGDF